MFFESDGVSAAKPRTVLHQLLREMGAQATEVFPKQDRLDAQNRYGNFVNAPLFGALVPHGRTVFVDPSNGMRPWPDQWDVLARIETVPVRILDDFLMERTAVPTNSSTENSTPPDSALPAHPTYGLPPCAQRMLAQGVTDHQRVTCFRLALHLKKAGMPMDVAECCLRAWARKNRPRGGKRIITPQEVAAQVGAAYEKSYRGCGCEDPIIVSYCDPTCPLHSNVNVQH